MSKYADNNLNVEHDCITREHDPMEWCPDCFPITKAEIMGIGSRRFDPMLGLKYPERLNDWVEYCKLWRERKGFDTGWHNLPEKAMLIVTEIAEMVEAHRSEGDSMRDSVQEELADAVIRCLDLAGSLGLDLQTTMEKKMAINEKRPMKHGKRY